MIVQRKLSFAKKGLLGYGGAVAAVVGRAIARCMASAQSIVSSDLMELAWESC